MKFLCSWLNSTNFCTSSSVADSNQPFFHNTGQPGSLSCSLEKPYCWLWFASQGRQGSFYDTHSKPQQPFHASPILLHHYISRDGAFSLAESCEVALPQIVKRAFWGVGCAFNAMCKLRESHSEMRVPRVHC